MGIIIIFGGAGFLEINSSYPTPAPPQKKNGSVEHVIWVEHDVLSWLSFVGKKNLENIL